MTHRLFVIALAAAGAVRVATAQVPTTIAGATVSPVVRDTIQAAGAALGAEFKGNADNIGTGEFWASGMGGGAAVTDVHVAIDYSAPISMRLEYVKNGQRTIELVALDGNTRTKFAWNETQPGGGATPMLDAAEDRQLRLWTMTPQAVLKAAVNAGTNTRVTKTATGTVLRFPSESASCRDAETFRTKDPCTNLIGQRQKQVRTDFTVTLDAKNVMQKVTTRAGTAVTETTFADYKDFSEAKTGKLFPAHIVQKKGATTVWDLTVTKADLDYPTVVIVTPDTVRDAAARGAQQ